jgi:hypothetical protein
MLTAWIGNDIDGLQGLSADNVTWIDDTAGLFVRKPGFTRALEEQLGSIGAGPDGVNAELEVSALTHRTIGERRLVTFDMALSHREQPKLNTRFRVIQIWAEADDSQELVINFMARARGFRDAPISNMDYTAYPVSRLGVDGRYYKTLFGSEPYRDDNWFGFWSTSSVFGLVGDYGNDNSYSPVRHRSNGYADLNMRSAEEVFEYLQRRGAEFALVEGINNQAGIDDQPGYRQILVVDSEGNLINFSQYLEY